jgi:hypothetical protein
MNIPMKAKPISRYGDNCVTQDAEIVFLSPGDEANATFSIRE